MTPARIALAAALVVFVTLSACGVKSPPIAPELARPERIFDLQAVSQKSEIRLSWHRPDHYAGGATMRDLADFRVSRSEGDGPYLPVNKIQVTDRDRFQKQQVFNYLDGNTIIGRMYHYEVVATTTDGYTSEPSNVASVIRRLPPPPPNPENFVLPTPAPKH
jgi:hypothetical protein